MAVSSDGRLFASGSYNKTVRLWNPTSGASLRMLEDHSFWVTAVAFSPDGKHLASGSNDKTDRLWDVKGTVAGVLAIEFTLNHLSISSDGRPLETAKGNLKVDKNDQRLACSPSLWTMHEDWIAYGIQRLPWLSIDFRPECSDRWGDSIAIGTPPNGAMPIRSDHLALPW